MASFQMLVAVLCLVAVVSSHQPPKGYQQFQHPRKPQAQPTPATDSKDKLAEILAIILPKIHHKLAIFLANIGHAITGAVATTFNTGFKPLTVVFIPFGKSNSATGFTLNDPEGQPLVYMGDEENLRAQETTPEDIDQSPTRKR